MNDRKTFDRYDIMVNRGERGGWKRECFAYDMGTALERYQKIREKYSGTNHVVIRKHRERKIEA